MNGKTVGNVAQFNSDWYAMGYGIQLTLSGYNGGIENLALYNGEVDALGHIDGAGFYPDTNVTRWNGTDWLPFIAGVNGSVRCLLSSGTTLYAGGDFAFTWGTSNVNHVLGTDGSSISSFTTLTGFSGVNGSVRALGLHKFSPMIPSLVVGGSFSTAGSVAAANVALFGNGTWAQVGGGFNNSVFALADYSNTLYAAGAFTASGITPLTHLAKYVSGSWVNPGAGAFNNINALMVTGGKLIIGGVPGGEGVSAWNGVSLTSYGSANGPVNALATYNGDIIAGGSFTTIGGQSAVSVARRDSATGVWHAMAQGLPNGAVYALAVHATHLYAGGNFVISGSPNIVRLAEWTGTSWVPIGTNSGLDGDVVSLASFNGRLHVGGFFNQSLDHVLSPYWIEHDASGCDVAVEPWQDARGTVLRWSYPNPARHLSHLDFSLESPGRARLEVFDITGREVKLLHDGWYDAGEHEVVWDGTNEAGRPSPAGIYFYRLDADGRSLSEETVRVR